MIKPAGYVYSVLHPTALYARNSTVSDQLAPNAHEEFIVINSDEDELQHDHQTTSTVTVDPGVVPVGRSLNPPNSSGVSLVPR